MCNKPRDQTGREDRRGQVISDKINFSKGKSKLKEFFFFLENSYNELCESVVERKRRGRITLQVRKTSVLFD